MIVILVLIYVLLLVGCNRAADSLIRGRAPAVQSTPRRTERPHADPADMVDCAEAIARHASALERAARHERDPIKRSKLQMQASKLQMQASKLDAEAERLQ